MNRTKFSVNRNVFVKMFAAVMLYLPIQEAFAQIEEILVTSRRYEESITDVPIAVAVMDRGYLEDQKVDSIQDILELSPGATWDQFSSAQPVLALRGISGGTYGNATLESAVQVVYDGVPLTKAFMMTIPTYDLQRVEVLRGPQGTTFGRNATLGLIHFVSARPSQETSGSISASTSFESPDLFSLNGHVNGALSDTISARLAFNYQDADGALEDAISGEALEGTENTSVRASLLFEPSDTFSALVKAEVIKNDDLPQVRRGPDDSVGPWLSAAFDSYTDIDRDWTALQDTSRDLFVERDILFLTTELQWALDNDVNLTTVFGYQDGESSSQQDAFGTPFALRDQDVDNDAQVTSLEFRVDNTGSSNQLRWLAGASYTDDQELREEINVGFPERGNCGDRFDGADPLTNCPEWTLYQRGDASNESFGVFGEIYYDISNSISLTVGGRYTDESRDYDWTVDGWGEASGLAGIGLGDANRDCADPANRFLDPLGRGQQSPAPGIATICGTEANPVGFDADASQSWDNFSGKVSLSYAYNDSNNFYVTYSEGYKAGGFQHDARNIDAFNLFVDPEDMTNIELGWKGSYENAVFAVTAFDQEQKNSQVGLLLAVGSGNANTIFNAASVLSQGIELEGTFALTENWQLGGNLGIYDAEYGPGSTSGASFDNLTGELIPSGEDISGERPDNSPEQTYALWTSYTFGLSDGSSIRLRADTTHRSDSWSRVTGRDARNLSDTEFLNLRPELNKFGLDATWTSADENLRLSIWGRNLDDEMDQLAPGPGVGYIFNLGVAGPEGGNDRIRPRGFSGRKSLGVTASYDF